MGSHNDKRKMYESGEYIVDPGDAGHIVFDQQLSYCPVVTTAAQTRTVDRPAKAGLMGMIFLQTDGGDATLTVTGGYNQQGDTSITMDDAGDYIVLASINVSGTIRWQMVDEAGCGIAEPTITVDTLDASTVEVATLKLDASTVAAAGGNIATAGALSEGFNLVTAADNTKGVQLPAGAAGKCCVVMSATVAKSLPVYPPTSGTVDNGAANAAKTLAAATAYTSGIFFAYNATAWYSFASDIT